jgi:hypothetical protein
VDDVEKLIEQWKKNRQHSDDYWSQKTRDALERTKRKKSLKKQVMKINEENQRIMMSKNQQKKKKTPSPPPPKKKIQKKEEVQVDALGYLLLSILFWFFAYSIGMVFFDLSFLNLFIGYAILTFLVWIGFVDYVMNNWPEGGPMPIHQTVFNHTTGKIEHHLIVRGNIPQSNHSPRVNTERSQQSQYQEMRINCTNCAADWNRSVWNPRCPSCGRSD